MVTIDEIEFLYRRYGQATTEILNMKLDDFYKFMEIAYKNFNEERCWQKWLVDNSEQNYNEYKTNFFKVKTIPNLERGLELAKEIKRKEEFNK